MYLSLLPIRHLRFPFAAKAAGKGAVLQRQDHSLPKNQWLTEAGLALPQMKGLWSNLLSPTNCKTRSAMKSTVII